MALLEEKITEKLETGAPPIKYEGDMRPLNENGESYTGPPGYQKLLQYYIDRGYPYAQAAELAFKHFSSAQAPSREARYEPKAFGGIAGVGGRRAYGLGSSLKRRIRKIIPNEIADVAAKAAPVVAPFFPGPAALMRGIGRFDKRGSISDAVKQGLLTYGAGKGAQHLMKGRDLGTILKGDVISGGGTDVYSKPGLFGTGGEWGLKGSKLAGLIDKFPGGGWGLAGTAAAATPFVMDALGKWDTGEELEGLREGAGEFDYDYDSMISEIQEAVSENDYPKFKVVLKKYKLSETDLPPWENLLRGGSAEGGRIGYGIGGWLKSKLGLGRRESQAEASPGRIEGDQDPELLRSKLFNYFRNRYRGDNWRNRFRDEWTSPFVQAAQGGRIRAEEGGLMANMDMIALEFMQEFGYDMMLANPEVREDFIQRWKEKNFYDKSEAPAEKRVMAQEGGLMNLGGMEKDYRNEGGFVPIGGKEKADDVPARLSRNEFVFTADAVRNAGGGNIDKGAEIMENVMKNLEQGGRVSEESQGKKGAREMFKVSERLSEVI